MSHNGIVRRGPLSKGDAGEDQENFAEVVKSRLSPEARGRVIAFSEGGSGTLYINYFNVPADADGGNGGGAERENNRLMITVSGFDPRLSSSQVRLRAELSIRFTPSKFGDAKYKLRTKTASAESIAEYVAGYINMCAESAPRLTHSAPRDLEPNRGAGPEGGGRGVPRGARIDWRFKGRDTTQMLFVTKEPDGEYYLWHEAYGKKPDWTYSFSKKPDAIAALNEQAGHSHRPNSSTLEPNRNLTRFQLERLLADQGISRSEISRMTDDQLRRAVGHDRLVAAGDITRNGYREPSEAENRPLASKGLTSYRYRGTYGPIMIGARDHDDALREARRSTDSATDLRDLEIWDGERYVPVSARVWDGKKFVPHPGFSPNGRREEADERAARELSLFIENDYDLVGAPNSQGKSIEKNLLAKAKRGTFDLALSEKAWMYLMETGAKKYAKEYASVWDWAKIFNPATRELVAHEFATTFAEEHGLSKLVRNGSFEVDTFDAPAHWASAFVNGDTSGLEEDELAEFESWCDKHPDLTQVVDVSEETHFGRFNGLQTELATYTCHVYER